MKRKAQEFGYKKGIGFSVILSVAQEKSGKALLLAAVRFCKLA